jgi:selT/selW/selH-like putative selenoprotein
MAAGLAAEIKENFGVESERIASGGGVFEITVDGSLIFSKKKLGRFPEEGEIKGLIEAL